MDPHVGLQTGFRGVAIFANGALVFTHSLAFFSFSCGLFVGRGAGFWCRGFLDGYATVFGLNLICDLVLHHIGKQDILYDYRGWILLVDGRLFCVYLHMEFKILRRHKCFTDWTLL